MLPPQKLNSLINNLMLSKQAKFKDDFENSSIAAHCSDSVSPLSSISSSNCSSPQPDYKHIENISNKPSSSVSSRSCLSVSTAIPKDGSPHGLLTFTEASRLAEILTSITPIDAKKESGSNFSIRIPLATIDRF